MASKLTPAQAVKAVAEVHTTLCLFEAACSILEGSDIRGDTAQETALKAVRLLRVEQGKLVSEYDRYTRQSLSEAS